MYNHEARGKKGSLVVLIMKLFKHGNLLMQAWAPFLARGGEDEKCAFLEERGEGHCSHHGRLESNRGTHKARAKHGKSWALTHKQGGSVCVYVYERLALQAFHGSLRRSSSHKRNTHLPFYSK